jgi:hypothetical protein
MKKAVLQKRSATLKDAMTAAVEVEGLLQKSGLMGKSVQADNRPDDPMELGSLMRGQRYDPDERAEVSKRMLQGLCMNCGEADHMASDCKSDPVGSAAVKFKEWKQQQGRGGTQRRQR